MRRAFLPLLTLALALLILVDRIGHMKLAAERAGAAVQGPSSTQSGTAHPDVTREVIRGMGPPDAPAVRSAIGWSDSPPGNASPARPPGPIWTP